MSFDLAACTIFVGAAGSQAQGTAREGSDLDLRGVCIAPLGQRVGLQAPFEQFEGGLEDGLHGLVAAALATRPGLARVPREEVEVVVFDLRKFVGLCAQANPTALEILFTDVQDWLYATPAWEQIHRVRELFLSQKVQQTFLGYAMAQLKRIQTHRSWLLEPPVLQPRRKDFGLPDAATLNRADQQRIDQALAAKLRAYGIDDLEMAEETREQLRARLRELMADLLQQSTQPLDHELRQVAAAGLALPADVQQVLAAERRYGQAMRHWRSYQTWLKNRNPARAALEQRFGYDTKHAMHLLRLMRMGLELLRGDTLQVRRLDAAELLAIRDGAWTLEQLLQEVERLRGEMVAAAAQTGLPAEVDRSAIEELLQELLTKGA